MIDEIQEDREAREKYEDVEKMLRTSAANRDAILDAAIAWYRSSREAFGDAEDALLDAIGAVLDPVVTTGEVTLLAPECDVYDPDACK